MENIINFIGNNYSWFLTITIILLFALIGYIFDSKKNKNDLLKKTEIELDAQSIDNIIVPEGKSLADAVNTSKNINPETMNVELTDEAIIDNNEQIENSKEN